MNRLIKEAHTLEEINGIRCAVVEKNATPERVRFLTALLEANGYTVHSGESPPPKVAPKPADTAEATAPPPARTYTIGVTDPLFHAMLAVYERALLTPQGDVVTIDYWNQQPSGDDDWYWKRGFFTNSL